VETLDLDRLRKLALCPHRWDALVNKCTHDAGHPGHKLTPKSKISFRANEEGIREGSDLIPGGRYLLTTSTELHTLKLWDLGLPGKGVETVALVAEKTLDDTWEDLEISVYGECIRVIIGTYEST
jgi:Serine/threonine protein phosphatase 2A, regulatory subunit